MNLLPKSTSDFSSTEYWNKFFKSRGKDAFEWYGEYSELCGILHKYIRSKDHVLVVGCGNSKLSQDLYDVGYRSIINIDISSIVIKQMQEANKPREEMTWKQMDATDMDFDAETFNAVLDKGTLDAMLTDESEEVLERCQKYLQEATRVLSDRGGRFVCVSLLQSHILKFILRFFPSNNFMLRIVRCVEAERKTAETSTNGQAMPVFVIIATKFKSLSQKLLEVSFAGEAIQRLSTENEVTEAVEAVQQSAMVQNGLVRDTQAALDKEIQLDLYMVGKATAPRYTVYILDQKPVRNNGKFACFVVPQGRETEWMFSTTKGRRQLQESCRHNRLAIVTMHREHVYPSLDEVQRELDAYITSLMPNGLTDKIPYLSLGSDVGQREIICKGSSDFSGSYVVEDVLGADNKIFRRLVFLNNQFTIQSEAAIKQIKGKSGTKKVVDKSCLSCQHHLFMTLGLNLVSKPDRRSLIIGLGGGALCTFIQQCFPDIHLTAIEIDPVIFKIAIDYFGLSMNDKLQVKIQDGLEYLKEEASDKSEAVYDSILFDVDSKDSTMGISCPPKAFLDPEALETVKKLIGNTGIFILNLVCRDNELRDQVVNDIKRYFTSVCAFKLDEDLNEILYCRNISIDETMWKKELEKSAKNINSLTKKQKMSTSSYIDIKQLIQDLKI